MNKLIKLRLSVKAAKTQFTKLLAKLMHRRTAAEWPASVVELAGAWKDLPTAEEIRKGTPRDLPRELI
jgi:hypothetical protein